jgi:hypothetical protein
MWIAPTFLGVYLASTLVWWFLASQNESTNKVLKAPSSWTPIIGGMIVTWHAFHKTLSPYEFVL